MKRRGRHQKWFVRDRGPSFGPEGVEEDVKVVRLAREAAGDDVDLMFGVELDESKIEDIRPISWRQS